MTETLVFTPRAPVNLFRNAKSLLGTVFETVIAPELYAEVNQQNEARALRETVAILTRATLTNTSASARTVDFRVRSSRRITYRYNVVAQAGQNWIRLDRRDRPSQRGSSIYAFDWSTTPPLRVVPEPALASRIHSSVAWTSDSQYLASGVESPQVRVYDAQDGFSTVATLGTDDATIARTRVAVWSPDNRYLAVSYSSADIATHPFLKVFDFDDVDNPVEVSLPNVNTLVTAEPLALDWGGPAGRYLVVGRAGSSPIIVYDWNSGSPVHAPTLGNAIAAEIDGIVLTLGFSPDATYLAVGHNAGDRLTLFTWPTATTVAKVNDGVFAANTARNMPPRQGLAWSGDSTRLAVLSAATSPVPFTVYDFNGGITVLPAPDPLPSLPPLLAIALSPDASQVVVGHSEAQRFVYYPTGLPYVLLWNFDSADTPVLQNGALQGSGSVRWLAFSPDNDFLAVAGWNYDRSFPPTGVDNVRLFNPQGANLVVNGSFEDTTGLTRESFGFTAINEIPGWFSDRPEGVLQERIYLVNRRFANAFPTDGALYHDPVGQSIAGDPLRAVNSSLLRQNFDDLVEGETYRLEIDITSSQDSDIGVQVLWNGVFVEPVVDSLPIIDEKNLLSISLSPGQSVQAPLDKHILVYGDTLQARASGAGVVLATSYVASTQEAVLTSTAEPNSEVTGE